MSLKTQPRPSKERNKVSTVLHMNATVYIWDDIAVGYHMIVSYKCVQLQIFPFQTLKLYKYSRCIVQQLVVWLLVLGNIHQSGYRIPGDFHSLNLWNTTLHHYLITMPCTPTWESNMIITNGLYFGTSNHDLTGNRGIWILFTYENLCMFFSLLVC